MRTPIGMFGPEQTDEEIADAIMSAIGNRVAKHGNNTHDEKAHGNWADGSGGGTAGTTTPSTSQGSPAPAPDTPPTAEVGSSAENPIETDDIEVAAQALREGKFVRLSQAREVSTLLGKLQEMVKEAEALGEQAPNFDLCKVSVKGSNLFCSESLGIDRVNMPQLSGKAREGSVAASMLNEKGEADIKQAFVDHLVDRGVAVTPGQEMASYLRATQRELVGAKVAGMASAYRTGTFNPGADPIIISNDNYVLDGHHRWASLVAVDLEDNVAGDIPMNVIRVDMSITELLPLANDFANEMGIMPKMAKRWMTIFKARYADPEDPDLVARTFDESLATYGQRLGQIGMVAGTEQMSQPGTRRGQDSMGLHGIWEGNDFVAWTPERKVFHTQVLSQLEADQIMRNDGMAPQPGAEAILVVGLPGSGKTHITGSQLGSRFDLRNFVSVSIDDLKEALLAPGDIAVEDLAGPELTPMVNAEAAALLKVWERSLASRGLNMIVEMTGSDQQLSLARAKWLIENGYTVHLVSVDVTPDEALASTTRRASQGGRPVATDYMRGLGSGKDSNVADTVQALARTINGQVLQYRNYPVSGQDPVMTYGDEQ